MLCLSVARWLRTSSTRYSAVAALIAFVERRHHDDVLIVQAHLLVQQPHLLGFRW